VGRRAGSHDRDCVRARRAREHLLELSRKGVGRRAVSAASGVTESTLGAIRQRRLRWIKPATQARILGVTSRTREAGTYVRAGHTWRLLELLLAHGYTAPELARHLGSRARRPRLQYDRTTVRAKSALAVERLYRRLTH
jgi:hypothetical protein